MNEQLGRQTYRLERPPVAVSWANIGGRQEEAGPLSPETREMIRQALAEALGGRHRWLEALLRALCGG